MFEFISSVFAEIFANFILLCVCIAIFYIYIFSYGTSDLYKNISSSLNRIIMIGSILVPIIIYLIFRHPYVSDGIVCFWYYEAGDTIKQCISK